MLETEVRYEFNELVSDHELLVSRDDESEILNQLKLNENDKNELLRQQEIERQEVINRQREIEKELELAKQQEIYQQQQKGNINDK